MFQTGPDRIDFIDAMRQGVDYHLTIEVRKARLVVRPLTMKETVDIATAVNNALIAMPKTAQTALMESTLLAKETLKKASTPDVNSPIEPQLTDLMMDNMTPEELQFIHRQYVAAVDKVNPVLEKMSKEQLMELVEAIKKNESALTGLSFLEAVNICRYLISGN